MDDQKIKKPICSFRDWELALLLYNDDSFGQEIRFQFRATNNVHDPTAGVILYDRFPLKLFQAAFGEMRGGERATVKGQKGSLEMKLDTNVKVILRYHQNFHGARHHFYQQQPRISNTRRTFTSQGNETRNFYFFARRRERRIAHSR